MLIFNSDGKLTMIQLATPKQFAGEVLPVPDQIVEKLLEPQILHLHHNESLPAYNIIGRDLDFLLNPYA